MGAFSNWRAYRKLPAEWRSIVFYSESGQDWHYFEDLIEELNGPLGRKVTYVTSDAGDPGLARKHPNYRALCIPEGWFLTLHFQFQKAGVVVLTMMDLDTLQLKRSINGVHYIYLFHSMGSTHMVDHADSYDAYDSLFCVGPHHVRELRKREELAGLQPRHLVEYGHPRLEKLIAEGLSRPADASGPRWVLVAPTWGQHSIFNQCGKELVGILLEAGYGVIMRPHYQTRRLTPEVLDAVTNAWGDHENFEIIEQMGETDSLFRSHALVSDWSGISIEYALGLEKPVLFVDLPRRVRNPDWRDLGMDPFEATIRDQVGEVLPADALDQAPTALDRLLRDPEGFRARMRELRESSVFNLDGCTGPGAREIARLADERRGSYD